MIWQVDAKAKAALFLSIVLLLAAIAVLLFLNIGLLGNIFMYIVIAAAATWLVDGVCHGLGLSSKQIQERIRQANARRVEAEERIRQAQAEIKQVQAGQRQIAQEKEGVEKLFRKHEIFRRRQQAIEEAMVNKAEPRMNAHFETLLAELKTKYGNDSVPKEKIDEALYKKAWIGTFFGALEEEDAPCVRFMFGSESVGHENVTRLVDERPKPIKHPNNALDELLRKKVEKGFLDEKLLDSFTCFISGQVMQDPVVGEDGRTYDRFCLENIYYSYPGTYPHDRRDMVVHPRNLPRDMLMYEKIQSLVKEYQPCLMAKTVEAEHSEEN